MSDPVQATPHHDIRRWQERAGFEPLDVEVMRALAELATDPDDIAPLAGALVSRALAAGDSCLAVARLAETLQAGWPAGEADPPAAESLLRSLRASPLVGRGEPDELRPLVLDAAGRLYLRRWFRHEETVAAALRERLAIPPLRHDPALLREVLDTVLPRERRRSPDWQAIAILAGLRSPFSVITGGPGTGKTRTVLWLLAARLMLAERAGEALPRIALAAPTGKASARMAESLREGLADLACSDAVRAAIPESAATVHRLLGTIPGSVRFRHDAARPLPLDALVVDEVSMVDLPLMARLLAALPPSAAVILLGDRNQLDAVEAGNVLASVCAAAGEGSLSPAFAAEVAAVIDADVPANPAAPPLADHVIELRRNWRFAQDSGLDAFARDVLAGAAETVLAGLAAGSYPGVAWQPRGQGNRELLRDIAARHAELLAAPGPEAALALVRRRGLLTALRDGPAGCDGINAAADRQLAARTRGSGAFYRGRLLLVRENDYGQGLFNGDIGIVWDDGERLVACFPQADGVRRVPLALLPAHASAWALTIHKSQGSEFDAVRIVLPQADARVLGRELLYTAITRARDEVHLVASEAVLRAAITRSTRRASGLADMLAASS